MNIGFDLDKVFIDYPPLIPDNLVDRLYKRKSDGHLQYRIPSSIERWLRILTHYSLFRPPINKNIKFLQSISRTKNHKHYLVSSRFGFLKNRTEAIIVKYNLGELFDTMYFNYSNKQPHIFKDKVIRNLKIQKYVDDDLDLLAFLANRNPQTFFFWLNKNIDKRMKKNLQAITDLVHMRL